MNSEIQWSRFCEDYEKTAQENRSRVSFFIALQQELKNLAIPLIPLKGLELLLRAYPSMGFRPMADMDFLIRRQDVQKIWTLLEEKGLSRKPDEGLTFISADGRIQMDIVWDIWYLSKSGHEELWKRTVTKDFEGNKIQCLHPEDTLLYLMTYVTAHRGVLAPLFIQDLEIFLEQEGGGISWERFCAKVRRFGTAPAVYHGLRYARAAGLETIPTAAVQLLKPKGFREKIKLHFYENLVTENSQPEVSYKMTWLEYPGLQGKWKLLREKFLPTPFEVELRQGIQSPLAYAVYLIVHPWRALARAFGWKRVKSRLDVKKP